MCFLVLAVSLAVILSGCGGPVRLVEGQYQQLDPATDYLVQERTNGLLISIDFQKYQFIPDEGDVR